MTVETREKSPGPRAGKERGREPSKDIVPAASHALAVRSTALIARGLRDLARDSNWLIKKVFSGRSPHLTVSATGQVCAVSPPVRHNAQRIVLYDIELSVPTMALTVPNQLPVSSTDLPASFAWSPSSRYLAAAWGAWQPALHFFDLHGKMFMGALGAWSKFPATLSWSDAGKYLVAASAGGKGASLQLWNALAADGSFAPAPLREIGMPDWLEDQAAGEEFAEEGKFWGWGRVAFSPDEKTLAAVVEIEGDWADDGIVLLDIPSLQRRHAFTAQGHVTDLTWTPDGRQLVYCAAGQAYHLTEEISDFEPLPFGAELCSCHPDLPLCVCFSSWLKNSAKGRLFLVDLNRQTAFDEYAAEGVVDLRWSLDGSKACAITQEGLAYIYEPPLL
jgi:WD40 repeat protein